MDTARIARSPAEADEVLSTGKLALIHCVEGGFSLGASPKSIADAVRFLATRGVAYITIAHLVWRHLATNTPSIPFAPNSFYNWVFPQPDIGLSELGRAAIRAMVAEGVLVDITHMSQASLDDTFSLLDELDPDRSVPVLASHCGYRFGRHVYNLTEATVEQIADRGGVIGLILSPYFLADGLPEGTPSAGTSARDPLRCRDGIGHPVGQCHARAARRLAWCATPAACRHPSRGRICELTRCGGTETGNRLIR